MRPLNRILIPILALAALPFLAACSPPDLTHRGVAFFSQDPAALARVRDTVDRVYETAPCAKPLDLTVILDAPNAEGRILCPFDGGKHWVFGCIQEDVAHVAAGDLAALRHEIGHWIWGKCGRAEHRAHSLDFMQWVGAP